MSARRFLGRRKMALPIPANENIPRIRAEILIDIDIPVTQAEIEVFACLLDDWGGIAANDNLESEP